MTTKEVTLNMTVVDEHPRCSFCGYKLHIFKRVAALIHYLCDSCGNGAIKNVSTGEVTPLEHKESARQPSWREYERL